MATKELQYPLLFKITNTTSNNHKFIHAGVSEFTSTEGRVYMPFWMMQNIGLSENNWVEVITCELPRATYVNFQPQSIDFLDISDPQAVLEHLLRKYSALTLNETILFKYNSKDYYLQVLDIKPKTNLNAVSIIETDVNVDFAPPVGYVEPKPIKESKPITINKSQIDEDEYISSSEEEDENEDFVPYHGEGKRISGKQVDNVAKALSLSPSNFTPPEKKNNNIRRQNRL